MLQPNSDFIHLRNLLTAQKWKEADDETSRIMLKIAQRESEGWLNYESIAIFPCNDLNTIDQLWMQYSNGRFGFDVQKNIWLESGRQIDYETEIRIGEKVGWYENGWIFGDRLNFSLSAPAGHLPNLNLAKRGILLRCLGCAEVTHSAIASRISSCSFIDSEQEQAPETVQPQIDVKYEQIGNTLRFFVSNKTLNIKNQGFQLRKTQLQKQAHIEPEAIHPYNDNQVFALLKKFTFALPIIVGVCCAVINTGQSKQLICKRLEIRNVSCSHRTAYFFGAWSSADEPFRVQEAVVEKYHPKSEGKSYTAYRLAFKTHTGKEFFYYGHNAQQAYLNLRRLSDLLNGSGASSLELRYARPLMLDLFLLIIFSIFTVYLVPVSLKFFVLIPMLAVWGKGSIKLLCIALLILPISVTFWLTATVVQSDKLGCQKISSNDVLCKRHITYFLGTWSNTSEFKVQGAVVEEYNSDSNSDPESGFNTTYMLFLLLPNGKEICYACHKNSAHQVYSNLNKFNSILSGNGGLSLELNYEQSWMSQLLISVLILTFLPFAILGCELAIVLPIIALINLFGGFSSTPDDNSSQGVH